MSPRPPLPPRLSTTLLPPSVIARSRRLWRADTTQTAQAAQVVETTQAASVTAVIDADRKASSPASTPDIQKGEDLGPGYAAPPSAPTKAKTLPKRKLSAEHRAKISQALKGHSTSAVTRAKLSAVNKGRPLTAEHCAKLSQALKGHPCSAETRAKISQAKRGHPVSAETRAKISLANEGRPLSAEARANLSQALKGRQLTAEHRAKIGQAQQGRHLPAATRAKVSAAKRGERNPSFRHGAYAAPNHPIKTIEDVIDDLSAKQARLSALLDQELDSGEADTAYVTRLFSLHGQAASRLARLLQYQKAQANTPQDELSRAVNEALDELAKELGLEL